MHIYSTPEHITAFSTTREGDVVVDIPRLIMPHHQVHGTTTVIVNEEFLAKNPLEQALQMDGVDALSTDLSNICIAVKTADCVPVLLWDETAHVISAVHAGWKGTLQRIVEANIDVLISTYGINPANLHAIIGPCIGPESFEVGDEVYDLFAQHGFPMDILAKRYPDSRNPEAEKWHIDLWECNRGQLLSKGVKPENIHVSGIDTFTNYDRFFSARRKFNGRIINGIMQTSK